MIRRRRQGARAGTGRWVLTLLLGVLVASVLSGALTGTSTSASPPPLHVSSVPGVPTANVVGFEDTESEPTQTSLSYTIEPGMTGSRSAILVQVVIAAYAPPTPSPPTTAVTGVSDGAGDSFGFLGAISSDGLLVADYVSNQTTDGSNGRTVTVGFASGYGPKALTVTVVNSTTGVSAYQVPTSVSTPSGIGVVLSDDLDAASDTDLVVIPDVNWVTQDCTSGCYLVGVNNATLGATAMTYQGDVGSPWGFPTYGTAPDQMVDTLTVLTATAPSSGEVRAGFTTGFNTHAPAGNMSAPLIDFGSLPGYTATFHETGLPRGVEWNGTFDGITNSSTGLEMNFSGLAEGTLDWSVAPSHFYVADPSSGSVESGDGILIDVVFTDSAYLTTYPFVGGVAIILGSSQLATVNETLLIYPTGDCGHSLITTVSALDPTPLPYQTPIGTQEFTFSATHSTLLASFTVNEGKSAANCFGGFVWGGTSGRSFEVFANATPTSGGTSPGYVVPSFTTSFSGFTVSFTDSSTVIGGDSIASIAWNFGDGDFGSGTPVSHVFTAEGNYTVTETVTDAYSETYEATAVIHVTASGASGGPPPPPTGLWISNQSQNWAVMNWSNPIQPLQGDVVFLSFRIDSDCVQYFQVSAYPANSVFSSYNFTGLPNETQFCASVLDYNMTGNSTLASPTFINPLAPFDLTVLGQTTSSVELAWANVPGLAITGATVYVGTTCGTWTTNLTFPGVTTLANASGLASATNYCFAVADTYTATNGSVISTPLSLPVSDTTSGVPSGGGGGGGGGPPPAGGGGGSGTSQTIPTSAVTIPWWLVGIFLALGGFIMVLTRRYSGIAFVMVGAFILFLTASSFGTL